jgi:hypothetical protein
MATALEGFLSLECDHRMAGWLRAEVEAAQGAGYDLFEFDLFDVELFYAESRVRIVEAAELGYDDVELPLAEFLAAIPDVPPGTRMAGRPKRVFVPTPPPGEPFECQECHWKGMRSALSRFENEDGSIELACPSCDQALLIFPA